MSVNSMSKEQSYQLVAQLHAMATGTAVLTPTDLSSFISVAQSTLAAGYEPTLNAISVVLQKTLIAVRPYTEKFKGLEMTAEQWGGIIRKLNFADMAPEADPTHATVDGQSVDPYVVKKPVVLETRYVGSDVWLGHVTVFKEQLKTAFQDEGAFGSFMTGLMTSFLNQRTQWLENQKRSLLSNMIAAKYDIGGDSVIHLLTEYNAATGITPALTATTVMQPANYGPFMKWAYARISEVSRLMTERSQLFQQVITGYPIMRHTPMADQRVYMAANFLEAMDSRVLADTYHDNFLRYADVEGVSFWQAIDSPLSVSVKPVYVDNTGAVKVAAANVAVDNVIGIIFDRDALGYNIYRDELETSAYNPKGSYYNMFYHVDIQLQSDVTEKAAIFLLD